MWEEGFSNRLHIRDVSQHKRCTECIKHQCVIRKLRDNERARSVQAKLWGQHLQRQFSDRQRYWDLRAQSRLGQGIHGAVVTLIVDGMDHSKWVLPKSEHLSAKAFNSFVRPHLSCTGLICHGRSVAVVMADQTVVKGANFTIELLLHAFDKLTRAGVDLRHTEVNVQCDNCSKEAKSNGVLRLLSLLVATRRLGSARLQSGHSHEDIDQFFSLLGSFMSTKKELYNPDHVLNELRTYLSNPAVRPRECIKDAYMLSSTREWQLGL